MLLSALTGKYAERYVVFDDGVTRIVVADTVSLAGPDDAGQVIVTGSHGGLSAGEYARRQNVACLVCNDAGFGRNNAGVSGLAELDQDGIVGIAVGYLTARIGDGFDAWSNGVVSFVNRTALEAGFAIGYKLQPQLQAFAATRAEAARCEPNDAPGATEVAP